MCSYIHPPLHLVVLALCVHHEALAPPDDEGHEDQSSDTGTRIRLPIKGPTRVPPPPITVAAMGITEKSSAKREMPAHMYRCTK